MVALTEVCQQEKILLNNDIKKTFNFLWDSNYSNPSFATVKERGARVSGTSFLNMF